MCDIQTDKAVVSMEVDDEGVLAKIVTQPDSGSIKVRSHNNLVLIFILTFINPRSGVYILAPPPSKILPFICGFFAII